VVERRQASAPDSGGAAQAALSVARCRARWHGISNPCVCRRSASFFYVPEASRKEVLSFVIAGLDPAIHAAKRQKQNSKWLA
jgi:hypothetical protein